MTLDYMIGATLGGMEELNNLYNDLPTPQATFRAGSERVTLASGKVRDFGWPQASWNFPMLDLTQRDFLREFCSGTSEIVYICTPTDGDDLEFKTFRAVMVWPEEEDIRAELVFNLMIKFQYMIEVVES
jgi:hypothetical protein